MSVPPTEALAGLWRGVGLPERDLAHARLSGAEPALPSSFAVGTAAQAAIGAAGLAAAHLHALRGGGMQDVAVGMAHAAAEFRSESLLRVDGATVVEWDDLAGLYPTRDGWVRLHTNFAHHRRGVLDLLGCAPTRDGVAASLAGRDAVGFESEAVARGLCVTALRTRAAFLGTTQAAALAEQAPVALTRVGDAPAEPLLRAADRPLAGLRVLDLTRIIAGPVCGRTLAAHGAEVLLVTGPRLPAIPGLVIDTGRGKRAAAIELDDAEGRDALAGLLRGADAFVQGYRPGALAARGFGPAEAARLRPGIVYASLSAWGPRGPWSGRRGFDSLVQTASGFNADEAEAAGEERPRPLPAQALDHASGYLLALGVMAALARRACVGGSWHVEVSLARTGLWLRSLGRVAGGLAAPMPDASAFLEPTDSAFGLLTSVRHAAALAATPPRWALPPVPLGSHAPHWA